MSAPDIDFYELLVQIDPDLVNGVARTDDELRDCLAETVDHFVRAFIANTIDRSRDARAALSPQTPPHTEGE